MLAGELPRKQLRLVQAWIELHQDELLADWELAASGELTFKIAPLSKRTMHWDVKRVQALSDFRLHVETVGGQVGIFDMKPFLNHGLFRALKDPGYFGQVGIVLGAVTWPNHQDIAPETLLAGLSPLPQPRMEGEAAPHGRLIDST